MKPILIFSPAGRGFAAAANSDVDLNLLLALASSNPFRKISVEPPARASDEGLVAVMPSDDPPPVLDGDAGALVAAGAAGVSSLPQAAKATMAMSKKTPIQILWIPLDSCLIRLYKPFPPVILEPD